MHTDQIDTIALDFDDTLVESTPHLIKVWTKEGRLSTPYEQFTTPFFSDNGLILKKGELATYLNAAYSSAELKMRDPYVTTFIDWAHSNGISIEIVTASPGDEDNIAGWLQRNNVAYDKLTKTSSNKQDWEWSKFKATDAEILIDDAFTFANSFAANGRIGILYGAPWNQLLREKCGNGEHSSLFYADNWVQVERLVKSLCTDRARGKILR